MTLDDLKKIESTARGAEWKARDHAGCADTVALYRASGIKGGISLSSARHELLRNLDETNPIAQAFINADEKLREEILAIIEADLRGKARVLNLQARAAWLELGFYVESQEPKS